MTKVRAAVAQASTVPFNSDAAVQKVSDWAMRAAEAGADLLVFPEAFVGGYPKGSVFGAVVGDRTPEGRDEYLRYFRAAIPIPGRETEKLEEIAGRHSLHMVVGVIERDGSTLYCTALYLGPDGRTLGKRRKLMPTAAERLVWGFGDGSTMEVYDTPIGRLGAVLCFENLMPAARLAMYEQQIELYCAPTAVDTPAHHATMRHIAQEGRCFVLAANQFMTVGDFPPGHPMPFGEDPATIVAGGGSSIIGPAGDVLAGPVYGEEALLVADIDLGDITKMKLDLDVVGHYSRADIFTFTVDRMPRSAVTRSSVQSTPRQAVLNERNDELTPDVSLKNPGG